MKICISFFLKTVQQVRPSTQSFYWMQDDSTLDENAGWTQDAHRVDPRPTQSGHTQDTPRVDAGAVDEGRMQTQWQVIS